MNHNGVISLPTDGSSTYQAGGVVGINASGQAVISGFAANGLGVVLHDVKASETERPVDVQLFSGGGIVNLLVDAATTAIAVGDMVGFDSGAHNAKKGGGNNVGIALEANTAAVNDGSIIQVIL
jgi:predicted RecA/RadA family phage recombinase